MHTVYCSKTLREAVLFVEIFTRLFTSFSVVVTCIYFVAKNFEIACSSGAINGSICLIFNKRFDHLETLLTIHRPEKVLLAGLLCGSLLPSPQSKCLKRVFMLPQKYHASDSNMLL